MTVDKLISEMDKSLQFPGVSNAWTMPIKARIDMLATGIRTPIGIKVFGKDLKEIERLAREIEAVVRTVPARQAPMPSASSAATISRSSRTAMQLARYGLMVGDVQDVVAMALGAETVTTTVEGRERYAVNVRYPRELEIRSAGHREQRAGPAPGWRHGPAGRGRNGDAYAGTRIDPHRERAARGLHLRRHARPRPRRLCRRCATRRGRAR